MAFDPDLIAQIKSGLNIVDLVSEKVELKKSGKEFKGCCPFHDEKTPSFTVTPEKQQYYCFGCGEGGDIIKFVSKSEGVDFTEAIKILSDRAGISVNSKSDYKPAKTQALMTSNGRARASLNATIAVGKVAEKIDELAGQFDPPYVTKEMLGIELDAWAKSVGTDAFLAKQMLKDRLKIVEKERSVSLSREFMEVTLPTLKRRVHYEPGKLGETTAEIIDHLAHETDPLERIYVQGGDEQWLARILTNGKKVGCCERLTLGKLTNVLNKKFQFYVETQKDEKVVNCPVPLVNHFYDESRWPGMPYLKGIINLPVLRMDGTVTMQPGYDEESGYLLDFDPKKFELKREPGLDDAVNALAELRDLIDECAFADSKSRSGALAMMLTAVSRSVYSFAPLFAITANTPGAGKGALTEVATLLATGRRSSGMTTFHPEEVEFKKSLIATLQGGSPVVCFDNVDRRHEFGGSDLESALTSTEFTGRMLGANVNGSFSTQVLFLANGNRMRLSLDMTRRTILMTLDAKDENILDKTYSRDMVSHAAANRGRYVSAALTILQAYLREKPTVDVKPLNGYLQWSSLVRNSLLWLGEADPVPTSDDIFSLDGIEEKRADLNALMQAWYEVFKDNPVTTKTVVETAKGIPGVVGATGHTRLWEALEEVAIDLKASGKVTHKALSYYLRGNSAMRVNNMRIVKQEGKTRDGIYWHIEMMA